MKRQSDFQPSEAKLQAIETLEKYFGLRCTEAGKKILTYLMVACECNVPIVESLFYTSFSTWHVFETKESLHSRLGTWLTMELDSRLPGWSCLVSLQGFSWYKQNEPALILLFHMSGQEKNESMHILSSYKNAGGVGIYWNHRLSSVELIVTNAGKITSYPLHSEPILQQFEKAIAEFCRKVTA